LEHILFNVDLNVNNIINLERHLFRLNLLEIDPYPKFNISYEKSAFFDYESFISEQTEYRKIIKKKLKKQN
jgi:hypothetical protein